MAEYAVADIDEIVEYGDGESHFRAVRHHFGITSFGANVMVARAAGDSLIKEHEEARPDSGEELYVVTSGAARFEVGGESVDAPAGTYIYVPPGVKRSAVAREPETAVLVVGAGAEGKPYRAIGWELSVPLFPLMRAGENAAAAELGRELLAKGDTNGALYYNTACAEALAGETDTAIEHLRQAVALAPELADLARDDDDLAALRDKPEFAEIAASAATGDRA
ncbi:MAG TPA: cupin domain-containing protein [Solirubrobacteraceae bacterium]|nr:cupin domain-containing protein [Solirubrobacteraceae bacterium]